MESKLRKLTADEKSQLEREIKKNSSEALRQPIGFVTLCIVEVFSLLIGFLAGTLLSLICWLLSKIIPQVSFLSEPGRVQAFLFFGALVGGILIPLWLWKRYKAASNSKKDLLEKDLADGQVEVMTLQVERVISRTIQKDERIFLLEIDSNQWLCLYGDYLLPHIQSRRFPSKCFELIRTHLNKVVLDVNPMDEFLEAQECSFDIDYDSATFPQDGEILTMSFEQVQNRMK